MSPGPFQMLVQPINAMKSGTCISSHSAMQMLNLFDYMYYAIIYTILHKLCMHRSGASSVTATAYMYSTLQHL